ncbi:hypothetical protein LEMLEM_LOCUS22042, partial [Lemmus lemmus]
ARSSSARTRPGPLLSPDAWVPPPYKAPAIRPPRRARSDTLRSGHLSGCIGHPVIRPQGEAHWSLGWACWASLRRKSGPQCDSPSSSRCFDL